jgi:hypothetical protein
MTTRFFTFGFDHEHEKLGRRFDRTTIVKITADDPRQLMHFVFGSWWSFEYPEDEGPAQAEKWGYEVVEIAPPRVVEPG